MTTATIFVLPLVRRYQKAGAQAVTLGTRPLFFACEADLNGEHCSERFARIVSEQGLLAAVRELTTRCPGGAVHVPLALLKSLGMAFSGGYRPDPDRLRRGVAPASPYDIKICGGCV